MDLQEEDGLPMDQENATPESEAEDPHFDSDNVKSSPGAEIENRPETGESALPAGDPVSEESPRGPVTTSLPPDGPPELWVETKTDSGKSYYYHSVTRETTWTRPEGRNVQILTQAELEQMNAAKQMTPIVPMVAQQAAVIDPVRRVESRPPSVLFGAPPPRFGMPPPMGMPPPGFGAPTWMIPPTAAAAATQAPPPGNVLIDPMLVAKANEWTEHKAPDGRTFYYNASKGESIWEKPEALVQLEASRMAAMHSQQMAKAIPLMQHPPMHLHHHHHQPPIMPPQLGPPPAVIPPGAAWMQQVLAAEVQKRQIEDQRNKAAALAAAEEAERNRAQAVVRALPVDKSKPVSSTPISGTPWCVVWTGDGRVFFYNPSTKTSVWERPEELAERADVTKAMSTVPEALLASNPANVVPTNRQAAVQVAAHVTPTIMHQQPIGMGGAIATEAAAEGKEASESESGDEDEGFPSKKFKGDAPVAIILENTKLPPVASSNNTFSNNTNNSAVSAADAELQASKERSTIPLEQRITMFKDMLREKDVSAFSTWEKELHKIVFDQRYLLLTSKERKQIFEKYVKDRAEEERKEKRTKMKQKATDFRALMESAGLHSKSVFSEFAQKYAKDDRLRAIEKMRERESLFNEYLIEVRKRAKEESQNKKEQAKKDYIQMLRDHPHVDRHCRWSEVKKMVEGKSAYRAVESDAREDLFLEYCKLMKEEKKQRGKDKEKEKDKDKDKKDSGEKDKDKDRRKTSDSDGRRESTGEEDLDPEEEENLEEQKKKIKDLERQLRAEASLREREKEVQRTLAGHLRERDNKREHHKKGEAIGQFNALLTDLVRNSDLTWKEVKRQLRKDHRYPVIESALEREERERLFNEHVHALEKKKRDKYREMLDEIPNLDFDSPWKEVKRLIRDDPRYMKYNSSEKCEREFREYLRDKTMDSKTAFRELLQECKMINHKSLEVLRENQSHMHEIEEILRIDKRFLDLDHVPEERQQIIYGHLEELFKRGPPPPPTAAPAMRRK